MALEVYGGAELADKRKLQDKVIKHVKKEARKSEAENEGSVPPPNNKDDPYLTLAKKTTAAKTPKILGVYVKPSLTTIYFH